MDEVLIYEAMAEMSLSHKDKAKALAETAWSCARTERKKNLMRNLGLLGSASEDGVALQCVDV